MTNDSMREKLSAVASRLKDLTAAVEAVAAEFGEAEEKGPSLEEVRSVLAEISRAGKTAEMKALLGEFGAARLSDVSPTQYGALLEKAKVIRNA